MIDLVLPQQQFDWSKIHHVSGVDLQPEIVEEKFKIWDYVVENNLMQHDDITIRRKAALLLDDDTIYEYAFFKNDNEESFRYEAYQDAIVQCKYEYDPKLDNWDDPNRFIIFKASNQIGKSRLLVGRARKSLFTKKGRNIVIATNNLKLTQFILSEVKSSLNMSKFADSWKEDISDVNNTTMLTVELKIKGVKYTNRLICTPAGEGSLGYPIHELHLDEFDFQEDGKRLFWRVYYPRLNKTKGQCMVYTNPNPVINSSESILDELWNGDLFQRKFHFNFLDASWNTQEEFDIAKRNSPSYIFESTHLGERSDDAGSFLTGAEIRDMLQEGWQNKLKLVDQPIWVGVDLGKMRDNTVISLGVVKDSQNSKDKYLDLDIFYQEKVQLGTTYDAIIDRYIEIKEYYEEYCYGVAGMGYDATGQKTFMDILKIKGVDGIPVDFSSKQSNKTLLYNDFKMMAENRKVKCVHSPDCEKQLSNLVFKTTENKKLKKVENKTTTIHDDFPDSIVILIHIAVKPSRIQVTATHVTPNKPETKEEQSDVDAYYAKTIQQNNSWNRMRNPYGR